jgi:hypothetical protein
VERVLKKLAVEKAQSILTVGDLQHQFQTRHSDLRIDAGTPFAFANIHLGVFRCFPETCVLDSSSDWFPDQAVGPLPTLPETPSQGDETLLLALEALEAADYPHALSLVSEALEQGISWDTGRAEAHNLRGTFKYVNHDHVYISFMTLSTGS